MLSDKELLGLVEHGVINGVEVPLNPFTSESPIQPSSVDLHIGGIYLPGTSADEAGGENHPLETHSLAPGATVLIRSAEMLRLPLDIGGLAFPPSHFAVKALLVTNAGHVDPEYQGPLRFTIINMGHESQRLEVNDRVGTLILFKTNQLPEKGWTSRRGGRPGRSPNTQDLHYLAPDFADMSARAREIAEGAVAAASIEIQKAEQKWNRRLTMVGIFSGLGVALIVGIFGFYSPVAKLEMRVDAMREQFAETRRIDEEFRNLRSQQAGFVAQQKQIDNLEQRTATLEEKIRAKR